MSIWKGLAEDSCALFPLSSHGKGAKDSRMPWSRAEQQIAYELVK